MKRNRIVWVITVAVFVPFCWLVATSPAEIGVADMAMTLGTLGTACVLLVLLWRGHWAGRWLAHGCVTCGRSMRRIVEGELRPPSGEVQGQPPVWRCTHCGRLH
jgi:hypothetical protein